MMIINQRVYTRGSLPRVTPHGCMAVVSKGRADSERAQRGLGDAAAASPWRVASALRPGGVPVAMWNRVYQYIYTVYIYIYMWNHPFMCSFACSIIGRSISNRSGTLLEGEEREPCECWPQVGPVASLTLVAEPHLGLSKSHGRWKGVSSL